MSDVELSLVAAECKSAVEGCSGTLEEKARAAMLKAKDHWMDKDLQFRGAVHALLIHYGKESPEYERIVAEVRSLRKWSAFLTATQAGLSVNLPEQDLPTHEPIGLMKIWQEVNKP